MKIEMRPIHQVVCRWLRDFPSPKRCVMDITYNSVELGKHLTSLGYNYTNIELNALEIDLLIGQQSYNKSLCDKQYDVIIALFTLEHFKDIRRFVRMLPVGMRLIATFKNLSSADDVYNYFYGMLGINTHQHIRFNNGDRVLMVDARRKNGENF